MTSSLLPTYARIDLAFERGDGAWLTSTTGERYLDFGGGIAVAALGYNHPHLVAALTAQAQKLWHTSNLFQIPQAERLADRLVANSFADRVFFTNSGAEALEGAIKTARKYQAVRGAPERWEMVTFEGAFHGRTLATIAAGGNPKYIEGFGPKVQGFTSVPFGDLDAVKAAIGPQTGAILVEPIQGEGGIRVATPAFLHGLRALCDEAGMLLVFDEVQCGVGRTGTLFAYEHYGVRPDVMAIAKGIGGGFPLGAFLTSEAAGAGMVYGTHGTTFGGNPLATAVGNAVLDVVLGDAFLAHVTRVGADLQRGLAALAVRYPEIVAGTRGLGLMLGLELVPPVADFVVAARAEKLILIPAGDNVARLIPPLVIDDAEVTEGLARLDAACRRMRDTAAVVVRGAAGMSGALPPGAGRHFLDLKAVEALELRRILTGAHTIKAARRKGRPAQEKPLAGKTLAMIFDKPSTRTRVSFDVGMRELGGETLMLTGAEMQLGRGESIADTARVLSRFVDAIVIRVLSHDDMQELADHASVPVVNGLTKRSHPCQVMADVMTFEEHRGPIAGHTIAWTGDANNVLASWVHAAHRFDFAINVASPAELAVPPELMDFAAATGTRLKVTSDPYAAVDGASAVVTDCWVSMGDGDEAKRHNLLAPYQVNARLMAAAAQDAVFMHCLPAHRGEEVTSDVMDGPQSIVFDEAENRLHAQKGILAWCLGALPA